MIATQIALRNIWVLVPFFAFIVYNPANAQATYINSAATEVDNASSMPPMPGMNMDVPSINTAQHAQASAATETVTGNAIAGMDMPENSAQSMLWLDQLEAFAGQHVAGSAWQAEAWYGNDLNKLWLRSEGETGSDHRHDGDAEALWSHADFAYWNIQLGVRQDVGTDSHRTWAAVGLQGIAPYWIDIEATAYVSGNGMAAIRFRSEYDLQFTQRLILQPEWETNLYDKANNHDAASYVYSSEVQLGMRLRYEITRQFAPYVGLEWWHQFDRAQSFSHLSREPNTDTRVVIGLHAWL